MQSQKSHRPGHKPRRGSYSSDSDHEHGNSGQKVYPSQPIVCPTAGIGYSGDPTQPAVINTSQLPNKPLICPPYKGPESQPVVYPAGNPVYQPTCLPESGPIPTYGLGYDPNHTPQTGQYPSSCFPLPGVNISDGPHYPQTQPGIFPSGAAPYPTQGPLQTGIYPCSEPSTQQRTEEYGMHNNYIGYQDHSQTNYMPGVVQNSNYNYGVTLTSSQDVYNHGPANNYEPGVPKF